MKATILLFSVFLGAVFAFLPGFTFIICLFFVILSLLNRYSCYDKTFLTKLFIFGFILRLILVPLHYLAATTVLKTGSDTQPDAVIYNNHALYMAHVVNSVDFSKELIRDLRLKHDIDVSYLEFGGSLPPRKWYQYDDFVIILAAVYSWLGYSPLLVKLLNSIFGCLAAVALYFFALKLTGERKVAKAASFVLMFYPTLFFWSITGLKDSATILFFILYVFFIFLYLSDRHILRRILYVIFAFGMSYFIDLIRSKFAPSLFVCLFLVLILPLLKLFWQRTELFKKPRFFLPFFLAFLILATSIFNNPIVKEGVNRVVKMVTARHIASVLDPATTSKYKIFPEWLYIKESLQLKDFLNFSGFLVIIRAWVYFFLVPFPWQIDSKSHLFILPQLVFFYLCIPFILIGLIVSFSRKHLATFAISLSLFLIITPIALSEGVIGITVRHRDMFTPFWIVFAIYGFNYLFGRNPADSDSRNISLNSTQKENDRII